MSRHDLVTCLEHMRDHAREAITMADGRKQEDLETNRMLQLSLTRLVEIVGEAANRTEKTARDTMREIPWDRIIGMLHRMIHGYDILDNAVIWKTVLKDLPALMPAIEREIAKIKSLET